MAGTDPSGRTIVNQARDCTVNESHCASLKSLIEATTARTPPRIPAVI
jgi:hypothetical protein